MKRWVEALRKVSSHKLKTKDIASPQVVYGHAEPLPTKEEVPVGKLLNTTSLPQTNLISLRPIRSFIMWKFMIQYLVLI